MTTTVHIPERLLRRVDARAKALRISRNRVILAAIESSLDSREEWPPELRRMLERPIDPKAARELKRSLRSVRERRTNRRRPPDL